jgi:hypothetical protein
MRRAALAVVVVVAAVLAVPEAAAAKQITKVTACGTDRCVTSRDPAILQGLTNGGPPTVPPSTRGRLIRLRAAVAEKPGGRVIGRFGSWFVPSSGMLVAEDGTWMRLPAAATRSLRAISRDLSTFPASRIGASGSPPPVTAPADGGIDWLLVVVPGAVALAGGAALLALARRRRPATGGAPTGVTP